MSALASIKPTLKPHIFDLAREAGFDVTDWIESSRDPQRAKANPKYCYNWSFVQPGKVAIFNLWHGTMEEVDGRVHHSENYRADADFHRLNGGKQQWVTRGDALDAALQAAARGGLDVRVIVVDGVRRNTEDPASRSSQVIARMLDPEPWHLRHYDWATGAFTLVRGAGAAEYSDQFDVQDEAPPERRQTIGNAFKRDPNVRRRALMRAQGRCELCGDEGFLMTGGRVYLETHHIEPLADGGLDNLRNVIALCPDDHRRAHHSVDRAKLREKMMEVICG